MSERSNTEMFTSLTVLRKDMTKWRRMLTRMMDLRARNDFFTSQPMHWKENIPSHHCIHSISSLWFRYSYGRQKIILTDCFLVKVRELIIVYLIRLLKIFISWNSLVNSHNFRQVNLWSFHDEILYYYIFYHFFAIYNIHICNYYYYYYYYYLYYYAYASLLWSCNQGPASAPQRSKRSKPRRTRGGKSS